MYLRPVWITRISPAQSPHPTQIFWVFFKIYIAEFRSHLENGSNWSKLRRWIWAIEHFYFGRLKNHKITHLPPHFTKCKSITRVQLKIYHFLKLLCLIQLLTQGVNLSASQLCAMKLRFPLRQTWVDSDFIQNIWVIIWRVGALLLPSTESGLKHF